jgi:hypothetical protein
MAMRLKWVLLLSAGVLSALATPSFAQSVGVTAAVNQTAVGTAPAQKPRTMVLGDAVIHNEKINTNGKGLLQILLADGTSFTVGPNSSMVIDSFVYDPAANTAKVVATLGKGVFRFIGGRTSKSPDGAVLNTPVGTVGIRGGISDLDFSGHHGIPIHIDMLFGDSITLSNGGTLLGRLFQNGYSISIGSNNQVAITRTPPGWTQGFQSAFSGNGGHHSGGPGPTQVATALQSKAPSGPPTPSSGPGAPPPPPTQVATTQPPVLFTPPDLTSGNSTWAEINNSSLANVYALYSGPASINGSYGGNEQQTPLTEEWNGKFYLHYYFGGNDASDAIFFKGTGADRYDDSPVIPVTPTAATGVAGFSGGYSYDYGANGYFNLTTQGTFQNTTAGVGQGVTGTINIDAKNTGFGDNDNEISAAETASGTFSGDLKKTWTPK